MKAVILLLFLLAACSTIPRDAQQAHVAAQQALRVPAPEQPDAALPAAVSEALLPPLHIELPQAPGGEEERFSLSVVNLAARELFMALATDTKYSMLVHPDVGGTITAELKQVTLPEALESLQQLHDFDYEIRGARVVIKPAGLRSAVFQVDYLTGNRLGSSSTRVSSGSIAATASGTGKSAAAGGDGSTGGETGAERGQVNTEVRTRSASDFWTDLRSALEQLVGAGQHGRTVVISPQSGVVVVRAMQRELVEVERFLQATRLALKRQVILEAKIVEVQLNGQFQSGVNWAAFARSPNVSLGFGVPGATLGARGSGNLSGGPLGAEPGSSLSIASGALDSLFGIAVQTSNFAALISFLETQGTVHVLSSPRIATLNNQKAVLKVGTEEFFVTDLKPGTVIAGSPPVSTPPSVTLQPFFSGVVLDVTPQIDEQGNVMLHVRPSVSDVTTVEKAVNLGDTGGQMLLPLASSSASETDSIIRARDGQLVVIGGLMRQAVSGDRGQLPGLGDLPLIGALFRNSEHLSRKRELVILLRPIVIDSDRDWNEELQRNSERLRELAPPPRRTGLQ